MAMPDNDRYGDDSLEAFAPVADLDVDAGIRRHVLVLRSEGIETFESCQGGPGHAFPEPTIRFHGSSWAGCRAFAVAMENGLPVASIRRVHDVIDGQLHGPWWKVISHHGP